MNYHILLIEDNPEMSDNIASILELAKYKVTHASNGKAGVDKAQRTHPDLILCDVMMPELDGFGVLHILSKDADTADIPFIFLTAKSDMADLRAGMNLGADDYITKPFDGAELLRVIEIRLKKRERLSPAMAGTAAGHDVQFDAAQESKDLQRLSENRVSRHFRKRDLLYLEGQPPGDLYQVVKGKVKTYKINYDGKELITQIHKPGEYFGFMSLLEDGVYNENAEALEDTTVSVIPRQDFLRLLYSSKNVAHNFIKLISNNVEELENRLLNIAYQSVRQRVARALIQLNDHLAQGDADKIITIGRRDMSRMVGTATESLNRTLAEFRNEQLIEVTSEGLRIRNRAKLDKIIQSSAG